jgi:hypothetical protein
MEYLNDFTKDLLYILRQAIKTFLAGGISVKCAMACASSSRKCSRGNEEK